MVSSRPFNSLKIYLRDHKTSPLCISSYYFGIMIISVLVLSYKDLLLWKLVGNWITIGMLGLFCIVILVSIRNYYRTKIPEFLFFGLILSSLFLLSLLNILLQIWASNLIPDAVTPVEPIPALFPEYIFPYFGLGGFTPHIIWSPENNLFYSQFLTITLVLNSFSGFFVHFLFSVYFMRTIWSPIPIPKKVIGGALVLLVGILSLLIFFYIINPAFTGLFAVFAYCLLLFIPSQLIFTYLYLGIKMYKAIDPPSPTPRITSAAKIWRLASILFVDYIISFVGFFLLAIINSLPILDFALIILIENSFRLISIFILVPLSLLCFIALRYPEGFLIFKTHLYRTTKTYRQLDTETKLQLRQSFPLQQIEDYLLQIPAGFYAGDLDLALTDYQRHLTLKEEIGNNQEIAMAFYNIGLIHVQKGDLDLAMTCFQRSLALREEIGNEDEIATTLNSMGFIYFQKGDFQQALNSHENSLTYFNGLRNNLHISYTLYLLISVASYMEAFDRANSYLQRLQLLTHQDKNKVIDQRYRLAKALLLKTSKRLTHKSQAQDILQQLVDEKITKHSITVIAMLNLCELLLDELKLYGEKEVQGHVRKLLTRIHDIALRCHFSQLIIHSLLLEAKFVLLDGDVKQAVDLLEQARTTAEENGLKRLGEQVTKERDNLRKELIKWTDLIEKNVSLRDRIERSRIEEYIKETERRFNPFTFSYQDVKG